MVKKDGKTISFLANERLLVYDCTKRILFYINEYKTCPFRTVIPTPKNEVSMPLDTCTYSNPENTSEMHVRKTDKNEKGELVTIDWIFTFDTKVLVPKWMAMLKEEKNKLVEEKAGVKAGGFIHDTLLDVVKVRHEERMN